jgi:hypothetical protein
MKIKVLSINKILKHDLFINDDFRSAPSFSDFDVVIIDPQGLQYLLTGGFVTKSLDGSYHIDARKDLGFGVGMITLFRNRRIELENFLKVSGGILICYLREKESGLNIDHIGGFGVSTKFLDNYSWLPNHRFEWVENKTSCSYYFPSELGFISRKGSEVSFIEQSHPFNKYLNAYRKEIRFECIMEIGGRLRKFLKVISKNKVQEIISGEVSIERGKIIFIPPNISQDTRKEAGILLECIDGIMEYGYGSPVPEWISKYSLPNENKNEEQIKKLSKKILDLSQRKQRMEGEQRNISEFKGLLYEKGKRTLESLVRKAFRLMGFNVIEKEKDEEDYDLYIKENDLTIIGEIEGKDNSKIDKDKYRQLFEYIENESEKGVKCKGILIANAYRNTEPSERGEQFTQDAIRGCERQGFCRITTYQIFKIIERILSGFDKSKLEKLREDIIDCDKEFIFAPEKYS